MPKGKLAVLACGSGRRFAAKIAHDLRLLCQEEGGTFQELTKADDSWFADGEVKYVIEESIRGNDVYVIQCVTDTTNRRTINDNLIAALAAVDAAHQADAGIVTAVLPHFPYARQERKTGREGITARVVAKLLEAAGANRVLTLDIHSEAIGGFFERAVLEDVHASGPILKYFREQHLPALEGRDIVAVAPDVGSANKARHVSRRLHTDLAIADKERLEHVVKDEHGNDVIEATTEMRLVGNVREKAAFVLDDMIDTGGTMITLLDLLRQEKASPVYLAAALPLFTRDAVPRFDQAKQAGLFEILIGTDAVPRTEAFLAEHAHWYKEVSVAPLFARVIYNLNRELSISSLIE
jgi:ribose-phosphate pyrophosphokinase